MEEPEKRPMVSFGAAREAALFKKAGVEIFRDASRGSDRKGSVSRETTPIAESAKSVERIPTCGPGILSRRGAGPAAREGGVRGARREKKQVGAYRDEREVDVRRTSACVWSARRCDDDHVVSDALF